MPWCLPAECDRPRADAELTQSPHHRPSFQFAPASIEAKLSDLGSLNESGQSRDTTMASREQCAVYARVFPCPRSRKALTRGTLRPARLLPSSSHSAQRLPGATADAPEKSRPRDPTGDAGGTLLRMPVPVAARRPGLASSSGVPGTGRPATALLRPPTVTRGAPPCGGLRGAICGRFVWAAHTRRACGNSE